MSASALRGSSKPPDNNTFASPKKELSMRLPILFAAALSVTAPVTAHVTIWPKQSVAGAREKYAVRVPNEKQVDTIAIELRFPAGLKANSFEQKSGWYTEPVRDASGALVGVLWTGKLVPMQCAEFGLLAVNPSIEGEMVWTAKQSSADGTQVAWSGAAGSKTPAPRVVITKAQAGTH
jgi:Domain of unkown function (DUF1775)